MTIKLVCTETVMTYYAKSRYPLELNEKINNYSNIPYFPLELMPDEDDQNCISDNKGLWHPLLFIQDEDNPTGLPSSE